MSYDFIKEVILLLQEHNFKLWKKLILKLKNKYGGIIELALEYFLNSKNIDIVEFENFIQNIDKSLYLEQIFNIYFKNKKYEKSLEIGKILWNDIRVDKIILSKNILLVLQQYYEAFQTNLDETLYVKAFNTLKSNIDALDLKEIVQLLYHHIIFRKEVDEDLITKINRQLLRLSINEIDEVIINYVHLLCSIVTRIQRVTQDTILFDQKTKKHILIKDITKK